MLKKLRSKLSGSVKKSTSQSTLGAGNYSEIDMIRQRHQTFNELRIANHFTDVVLLSLDEQKFPAHRLILTSASSYFRRQCKRASNKTQPIIEVPIQSKHLQAILLYIYTGNIQISCENFESIFEGAEMLQMLDLQRLLNEFIAPNLSMDNILRMFRFSHKLNNEAFRNECCNFIRKHKNRFLATHGQGLKFDELFLIVNLKSSTCYAQSACEHIVRWVKFDPTHRLHHLQALLQSIDLTQLGIGYIDQLFADKILTQNQYFVKMAVEVFDRKLQQTFRVRCRDDIAEPKEEEEIQRPPQKLFALTEDGIYRVDFENERLNKLKALDNLVDFRSTNFGHNGIVITGSSIRDETPLLYGIRNCKYFCTATNELEDFPSMNVNRVGHQVANLNGKIYVAGGMTNSTEFFDADKQKWIMGESMLYERGYFEMTTNGQNNIYALGGCLWESSRIVEHFDVRTNKWNIVSQEFPSPDQYRITCIDDIIYCFRLPWVYRFDLRTNKWMEHYKVPSANVIFPPNEFDCVEFNDEIYLMGQFYTFGSRALQFNERTKKIDKLEIVASCCKNFSNFRFVKV